MSLVARHSSLVARHSSLLLAALAFAAASAFAAPSVVRVEGAPGAQRLTVNGKPFVIKGAGGGGSKKVLAQLGANSFRTWAANDAEKQLDEAQKNGLYVTVGHWLHSTSYFSYTDEAKNAEQTEGILRRVRELKDHPALLMWAIGNEMEAANPNNRALWTYMNDLAGKIKEIDPNHPVTTALMEVWPEKIALVNELCPNLDVVGINTYAGCGGIGKRLREAGLRKPFIITEYGPPLHNDQNKWWIGVTDFGAPQELSSTQKAKWYVEPARTLLSEEKGRCLGLYAFTWGFKVEATPTWFGLQLPDDTPTAQALELAREVWGGKVRNRGPVFETISEIYEQKLAQAKRENQPADKIAELAGIWPVMKVSTETPAAGAEVEAEVRASDPDGDALEYVWVLLQEAATYGVADTGLAMPRGFEDAIVAGQGTPRVKAVLPGGGVYRLFCYVFDKAPDGRRKSVATACRPLKGAGAPPKVKLPPRTLPFAVYKDGANSPWIPSGYMGSDLSKFSVDTKCTDNPHSGETCMKVKWTDGGGWAGLNWQSPANDWGDAPGGANVTGARFLQFWARGYLGDEKVSFHLGGIGPDRAFPDSGGASRKDLVLTDEWKRYRIDLEGVDLSCIKTGFGFSFGGQGSVKTFFLDDIEYVK